MTSEEQRRELVKIKSTASASLKRLVEIEKELQESEKKLTSIAAVAAETLGESFNQSAFKAFFRQPYVIIPQTKTAFSWLCPSSLRANVPGASGITTQLLFGRFPER